MHSPGVLLRDIRNIKKNSTLNIAMTSKDISSVKDLKKARSSEQLINLKGFLDTKNDKIKTIDQKLQMHQSQIQKNNTIIEELTNTMMSLKDQFTLEKQKVQNQEKKNRVLRDEIQRTNKLLKSKNLKIEELTKKYQTIQKQLEVLKPYQQKVEQLNKTNTQIRKQMSKLQQGLNDKKITINQLNKQVQKYKDKIQQLGSLKTETEKLKSQIKSKQNEIELLSGQLKHLQIQNRQMKVKGDDSVTQLNIEMKQLSEKLKDKENILIESRLNQRKYKQKSDKLQSEIKGLKMQSSSRQTFSQALKKQLKQLKDRFDSINQTMSRKQDEERSQNQKMMSMKAKIDQLQKKLDHQVAEKTKIRPYEQKFESICKKSKRLEQLYKLMVPQIQCPYGHELTNPITVIPCGHNYCLGCKKGYTKQCMMCNGKLKIEAVYRNQLMDDIINIVTGIKQILQMIK